MDLIPSIHDIFRAVVTAIKQADERTRTELHAMIDAHEKAAPDPQADPAQPAPATDPNAARIAELEAELAALRGGTGAA